MADQSPSNCTYCYRLECSVRIEPDSSGHNKATVSAKNAVVTVGRNNQRQIVLQLELLNNRNGQPAVASYSLKDAVVHQQHIAKGRSSIQVTSRNMIIQLSNCPPRKLNVFVKSLQAKLDLLKAESTSLKTPTAIARTNLMSSLPNVFNVLSPLSIGEIRKVRRMRGIATGESPLAKGSARTPKREKSEVAGSSNAIRKTNSATTPISMARERRLMASSLTLKRMRTFAGFDETDKSNKICFEPLREDDETEKPKLRVELSGEQKEVVRAVVQGKQSIFFTGSAGTGKSVILRRIIEMLPPSETFITAATGVAACQIGGITLHSFAGIGVGKGTDEQCLQAALNQKHVVSQWKKCNYLIIDEISMVDKDFFTKLEYVARGIRNKDDPFGGIQLIVTGDFLQLPPVSNEEPQFCFESAAWHQSIRKTIVLNEVRRQDDNAFVRILQRIRFGICDAKSADMLKSTQKNVFAEGVVPTQLCTHTADAQRINDYNLNKLHGEEKSFMAYDDSHVPESLQFSVPKKFVLKIGSQVMLTKNIDLARGLSNGSRGCVRKFSENGNPVVYFMATDQQIEMRRTNFSVRMPGSESTITRTQIPLQLAWAISIHKSQGLTLDCVEMSLARVFAEGQAYVALSRARSLASIKCIGFDTSCVRANQRVVEYYKSLNENDENDEYDMSSMRKRSRMSL